MSQQNLQANKFTLRQNVYQRFKDIFDEVKKVSGNENSFILVLDNYSLQIISSVLKMSELLKLGVSCVEKLELKRKKFKGCQAIYIIEPSLESIQKVKSDFKSEDSPQYDKIHVFFTRKLNREYLKQLTQPFIVKRIKTLKELNHDFFLIDSNCFHLNVEKAFPLFYSEGSGIESKLLLDDIGNRLLTIYPALLNFFNFSIISNENKDSISNKFAQVFETKLLEYKERLKHEQSKYIEEDSGQVYLVLVDRTSDVITPVIHDLYYESMMYDLLEINPQTSMYQYDMKLSKKDDNQQQNQTSKQNINDDNDKIFLKYRYKNISDCLKGISEDLQNFAQRNQNFQRGGDIESQDINKTEQLLNKVPEFADQYNKYNMHLNIIENCYKIFQSNDLLNIAELEQKLATGVDGDGNIVKPKNIKKQLIELITSSSTKYESKLRLSIISFLTLNLEISEKVQIEQQFGNNEEQLFLNLNWIDKQLNMTDKSKVKVDENVVKHTKAKVKNFKEGVDVEFCRHTPYSTLKIEQLLKILLDQSQNNIKPLIEKQGYSYQSIHSNTVDLLQLNQQSSSQSTGSTSKFKSVNIEMQQLLRDRTQTNDNDHKISNELKKEKKVIIFFLGGITYAEIRTIRQIQESQFQQYPIILGSTQILTPKLFIQGLQNMQKYG